MNLRFPSLHLVLKALASVLLRFPFTVLFALLGTACAIDLNNGVEADLYEQHLVKVLLCCLLGLPGTIAVQLIAEHFRLGMTARWFTHVFAVGFIAVYYFTLPINFTESPQINFYRFGLLLILVHLLVSIAPFVRNVNQERLWMFNQTLLDRMVVSVLSCGILTLGIFLALFSLEALFDIETRDEWYANAGFVVFGIANTLFFLFQVPKAQEKEEQTEIRLASVWRFLSGYILVPLVLLYLAILYCYSGKILFTWNWPRGWVSNLILGFSVVGILAQLLVYPIRNDASRKWIRIFSRFFFMAILPLLLLLALAIYRRVSEYGITEERYFLIIIALWLAAISLHYLFRGFHDIRLIPASLLVLLPIAAFGPLSAFSVSISSQKHRLEKILARNQLISDGRFLKAEDPVTIPAEDQEQVEDIVAYLVDHFGTRPFEAYFEGEMPGDNSGQAAFNDDKYYTIKKGLMEHLGLQFGKTAASRDFTTHYFQCNEDLPVSVAGFDAFTEISHAGFSPEVGHDLKVSVSNATGRITILQAGDSCSVALFPMATKLKQSGAGAFPRDSLRIQFESPRFTYRLSLNSITFEFSEGKPVALGSFTGYLMWYDKSKAGVAPQRAP